MRELKIQNKIIRTSRPAFIMGIVNVTPDSFFEGSRGGIDRAFELIKEGADLLDIGGESTRPGFESVSADEEMERILPVVSAVRKESDIPISIDTRKAVVFEQAFKEGADILNDVSALEDDDESAAVAAQCGCPVILMHRFLEDEAKRRTSKKIVEEVNGYLQKRAEYAVSKGIKKENIILDPGIGFGKTTEENIELIKNTDKIGGGAFPVLMALSRKRVIGSMTEQDVHNRLYGTLAADMIAVQKGAFMVRVHDVQPAKDTLNVMKYLI